MKPSPTATPPANAMEPCPALPGVGDVDMGGLMIWGQVAASMYNDCAARHDALIGVHQ